MLSTKIFRDGERVVLTIEGEDPAVIEEVISKVITESLKVTVFKEEDSKAEPLPKEEVPEIKEEKKPEPPKQTKQPAPEPIITIEDGAYAGKKPLDIVMTSDPKENEKGFRELVSIRKTSQPALKKKVDAAIMYYVKNRFKNVEPDAYAAKLNNRQILNFLDDMSYGGCIPNNKRTEFLNGEGFVKWNDMLVSVKNNDNKGIEVARRITSKTISMFKGVKD
ncbi:MAG: hypothetical protein J5525_12960 [Lachnospiraceae bacterium]|nr:hypothetical protein [Lachnospiraceae bacterium]